jgi:membrane protease YdiL (CAAX protease family)
LFVADIIPWQDAPAVLAVTFVFTAVYLRTGGSVLIAFLLHAAINGAGEFFIGLFEGADRIRMYWLLAAVCALIAVAANLRNPEIWRRSPNVNTRT